MSNKLKAGIKNFFFVTVPTFLFLFLLLELVFRFIIPAADTPKTFFDTQYNMMRFEEGRTGRYTMGKLAQDKFNWSTNNVGWNAPMDYQSGTTNKKRIAVIGDSYIEAFQVNNDESYPVLLDKKLGDNFQFYSFGMSGAPLSQYLHMSRYVAKVYDPDVMIINVVHNDFDESIMGLKGRNYFMRLNVEEGKTITERTPSVADKSSGGKFRFLKGSALVRYLLYNLQIRSLFVKSEKKKNAEAKKEFNANVEVNSLKRERPRLERVTDYVIERLKMENLNRRIILVIDGARSDISNKTLDQSSVLFLEEILEEACRKNEIELIKLTNVFKADFEKNGKEFNSENDYHWNDYGHQIVADHLTSYFTPANN